MISDNIDLPELRNYASNEEYLEELSTRLKFYLDQLSTMSYGDYQTYFETAQELFTPIVYGADTQGTANYKFGDEYLQYAWVLRRSLITDVWFDVTWDAHTGKGDLYLQLPYIVANSNGIPFVGTIQSSTITYAGFDGLVCNAEPNTYKLNIYKTGTGATTTAVQVDSEAVAGRIIGHVRYIGQDDEIADS